MQVPLRACDDLSTNWAKLEFLETKRFEDFLDTYIEPYDSRSLRICKVFTPLWL